METITTKEGFLLINKPSGPTSHDIVDKLRRITGVKKIGHAGTLDPFAEGLLIMAIGRSATREISKFVKMDKEYIATLELGASSDTMDRMGEIKISNLKFKILNQNEILQILNNFLGPQKQIPPMFSAKKINGKKLYELARAGQSIERVASDINIYELELLKYEYPSLEIRVKVSSGTYIRVLADDIGKALGCGAYLTKLVRTQIGEFKLKDAHELNDLNTENWTESLDKNINNANIN